MAGTIGRLFVEVGADTSKFTKSMQDMMNQGKQAGIEIQAAGRRMLESFEAALNPSRELEKQLHLLFAAGKTQQEVWTVMGDRLKTAAKETERMGQVVDPTIKSMIRFGEETKKAGSSFAAIGQSITDFARSPVQTVQAGLTGLLEKIGPVAVGIGGIATAAIAGGTALVKMAMDAADTAEQLQNLSIQTGLTTQDLQALQQIGKEKGVDLDLAKQLGKLNKELADAKGTGSDFIRTLNALRYAQGLPAADLSKGLIPALVELRERVLDLPEGFERAKAQSAALGKGFASLQPIIFDTDKSIADMIAQAKKSDAVWGAEAQEKLMAFDDLTDSLGRTFKGLGNDIAIATVSALQWFGVIESKGKSGPSIQQMYEQWAKGGQGLPEFGKSRFVNVGGVESDPFKNVAAELARLDAIASGEQVAIDLRIKLKQAEADYAAAKKDNDVAESARLANQIAGLKEQIKVTEELKKLSPSDELMRSVRAAQNAGATQTEIVQLYGKSLIDANAKQLLLNKSISDEAASLAVASLEREHAKEMSKAMTVALLAEDKYWADLENTESKVVDRTKQLETQTENLKKINAETTWKMGEDWTSYLNNLVTSTQGAFKRANEAIAYDMKRMMTPIIQATNRIFDELSRGFAAAIVSGKGFADTMVNVFKRMAEDILAFLIKQLFNPLRNLLYQSLAGIASLVTGGSWKTGVASAAGATGGLGNMGGMGFGAIPGLGVLGGSLLGGAGMGAAAGFAMPGPVGLKIGAGIGAGMFGTAAGITALTGTSLASSLGAVGEGLGFLGAGGLLGLGAMSVPVIGAAAIGLYYGIKALIGKNTQTAGAMEVQRDLAVSISKDVFKSFTGQYIDPSQAWGIRKDLYMSPAFLTQVAWPAAQQQGRTEQFLSSLEKVTTSWGTFNFRQAFEVGLSTGNWGELNKQYKDAFEHSTELAKMLPNWTTELMANSDATQEVKTETELLIDSYTGLRDSILSSITPIQTMYDKFLATGEITEEFAAQIESLGGSLESFTRLADLIGQQNILKGQLGFVNDIVSRMQALTPQGTIMEELFSGVWKPTTPGILTSMGLDPNKLKPFVDLTAMVQGWEPAVSQFQQTGKLQPGGLLYNAISQYGGTAGQVALQRLDQGFNTITPKLLTDTFTAMNEDYQNTITSTLDYLGTVQEKISDQITDLEEAINQAKLDVVEVLNAILVQLGGTAIVPTTKKEYVETPAKNTDIEMAAPGTPRQPPVTGDRPLIIINNVYGYDDFVTKVEQAGITLSRRGSPTFATA